MLMSAQIRHWIEIVACVALVLMVGVIASIVAARPTPVDGAAGLAAQEEEGFMYTVKFTCVEEVGPAEADFGGVPFMRAQYRTAVNIHNPQRDDVGFQKKAVVALSQGSEERGIISEWREERLRSDEALDVDCVDIQKLLGGTQPVGDGFVVIESRVPLDVVAVYTTEGAGIDVEYIQPKRIRDGLVE
jgi:hypothetical protein